VEGDDTRELIKALDLDFAQGCGIDKPKPMTLPRKSKLIRHAG